ncbi:FtsQ-type POTRA domain-containing protein [Lentisphaera profundi]|uniref:FtsQ-type POTRA domain-containing protein n=1 Tax=Lentisphaera profundi TaxID=1658616 RepID=A0ABY7VXY8_9BACT|nr:FtsQ-type POTRA domain-containing protein [Lentisphaera profundi]WDE98138.1 FtsQ-type POTRA domain-containing protein [Lentisphaera profundi]
MSRSKLLAKREEKLLKIRQQLITSFTWLLCLAMVLGTLLLLVSGMRLLLLSSNPQFTLQNIEIKGNTHITPDEIIYAQLAEMEVLENKINIFQVSPSKLREKLEQNPAIQEVLIERVLPNTLSISITEKQARAQFVVDGKVYLVSSDSTLLPYGDNQQAYLPLIAIKVDGKLELGKKINTEDNQAVFDFLSYYDSYAIRRNGETFFPSQIFKVARVRQDPKGDLVLFLKQSGISDDFKIARHNVLLKLDSSELALSLERACTFLIENRLAGKPINKYIDARSHRVFVE